MYHWRFHRTLLATVGSGVTLNRAVELLLDYLTVDYFENAHTLLIQRYVVSLQTGGEMGRCILDVDGGHAFDSFGRFGRPAELARTGHFFALDELVRRGAAFFARHLALARFHAALEIANPIKFFWVDVAMRLQRGDGFC